MDVQGRQQIPASIDEVRPHTEETRIWHAMSEQKRVTVIKASLCWHAVLFVNINKIHHSNIDFGFLKFQSQLQFYKIVLEKNPNENKLAKKAIHPQYIMLYKV